VGTPLAGGGRRPARPSAAGRGEHSGKEAGSTDGGRRSELVLVDPVAAWLVDPSEQ
jgi:hypothetical protein